MNQLNAFRNAIVLTGWFLGLMLLNGCGESLPKTHPVSGTITYQGKPVVGAQVMFTSSAGRPAEGTTDVAGKFTLTTFTSGDGALAGNHRVTVVKMVAQDANDPYSAAKNVLPTQYANSNSTPLQKEVPAQGKNEMVFELVD